MTLSKKVVIITVLFIAFMLGCSSSACAATTRIKDYSYSTFYRAGEATTFKVLIQNESTAAQTRYINVVLTNRSTLAEITPYPATAAFVVPASSTLWVTTSLNNWTTVNGKYTVTIILYNAADVEQHRVSGTEIIEVGDAEEYVSAFPNVIDFGALPYGRYMYPNPVKIHWNFFLKNELRKAQPWYMRIYTDNMTRYKGIEGAVYDSRRLITTSKVWVRSEYEGSPAGLVSSDGKYAIPLRVWCLNYGPDWDEMGWSPTLLGPPPVNDDYVWNGPELDDGKRDPDRRVWLRVPDHMDMTADSRSWRNLIGKDPFNRNFTGDNNPTGDFTLDSPFDLYFATETSPTTVIGKYSGKLIIEIYTP